MWLRVLVVCALVPAIGLQGCSTSAEPRAPQAVTGGSGGSEGADCRALAEGSGREHVAPPSSEACRDSGLALRDDRRALPVLVAVIAFVLLILPVLIAKDVAKSVAIPPR